VRIACVFFSKRPQHITPSPAPVVDADADASASAAAAAQAAAQAAADATAAAAEAADAAASAAESHFPLGAEASHAEIAEYYFSRYVSALRQAEQAEAAAAAAAVAAAAGAWSDDDLGGSGFGSHAGAGVMRRGVEAPSAAVEAERVARVYETLRAARAGTYTAGTYPGTAAAAGADNSTSSSVASAAGAAGHSFSSASGGARGAGPGGDARRSRKPTNVIEGIKHWIFSFRFVTIIATALAAIGSIGAGVYYLGGRQIDSGIKHMAVNVTADTINNEATKESVVSLSGKILTEPVVLQTAIEFLKRVADQPETQVRILFLKL
jgi:hypothetical protein